MVPTLALVGMVMMLLSVPLAARKVAPNRLYGFASPRAVADERVWYPVNRMTGQHGMVFALFLWGAALLGGLGLVGAGTLGLVIPLVFVLGLVATAVSAARIVQEVDRGGPKIDYRSSFEQSRQHDATKAREKLLDRLK